MALILDPSRIPEEKLRAMAKQFQTDLEGLLASIDARGAPKDPLGVFTISGLLRATIELGRATQGASVAVTTAVVNLQYETVVAAVDLIKWHFGLPTVPRGKARPPRAKPKSTRRSRSSRAG